MDKDQNYDEEIKNYDEETKNYDEEINSSTLSSLDSFGILQRTSADSSSSPDHHHLLESSTRSDMQLFKSRISKLLLGEDMSGCGKGVTTALAISNSITNLFANIYGELMVRLESLPYEKKLMWNQEIDCLVSVCDYIFEPISTELTDHPQMRPRSDIADNLPALKKLDNMLQTMIEGFQATEFWYLEKQKLPTSKGGAMGSIRWASNSKNVDKWWLPLPCVPSNGLSEKTTENLIRTRKCADQIYKAAHTINSIVLSEMEVPQIYTASLHKNARKYLGDGVYRYMKSTNEDFFPENLLKSLDLDSSEHKALEVADLFEASMYIWRRKASVRNEMNIDVESKNTLLANRTENTLKHLKHLYPQLSQTTLDISKIQYNTDIGQAILESYSRVLESLAFNVTSRIDDVLYIDGLSKNPHKT